MTTSAFAKAKANAPQATGALKAIEKTAANAKALEFAKAARNVVNAGLQRQNWDDVTIAQFTKAYDQLRYMLVVLTTGKDALEYVHEKGLDIDFHGRNRFGKQLAAIDVALGKSMGKYEQSAYMQRTFDLLLDGDAYDADYTLTARDLAYNIGASKDKPIGQTQVYAVMHALELVGAGKRVMAGRGSDWLASKVVLSHESDFMKAVSALC